MVSTSGGGGRGVYEFGGGGEDTGEASGTRKEDESEGVVR